MTLFSRFFDHIGTALDALVDRGALPAGLDRSAISVEPPRDPSHGDVAINAAMVLAKPAGANPRALAELLAAELGALDEVTEASVAGPGFINLRLADSSWRDELALIHELQYEAYFLTVWDLVKFARSRSILCQGRGSAANSAVCFCLGVTAVDPDRISVLFERFISKERGEAPDGIHPQLAALEMLIYPRSALVIANTILLALGTIEIIPPQAPFTLLIWGPKRVLPVRLTEFSITEEAYDPNLNPIRAKVLLGLRVLSYNDLPISNPGYALFLAHQVVKETLAAIGTVNNLAAAGTGDIRLF